MDGQHMNLVPNPRSTTQYFDSQEGSLLIATPLAIFGSKSYSFKPDKASMDKTLEYEFAQIHPKKRKHLPLLLEPPNRKILKKIRN